MALFFSRAQQPGIDAMGLPPFNPMGTPTVPTAVPQMTPGGDPNFPTTPTTPGGPMTPQKPSFFGQGGTGRAIAGSLGDVLLQNAHMQPIYAPAAEAQRRQAAQVAAEQRRQAAEYSNFVAQQQYRAAHPAADPTAMQQNYDWLKANHPEAADQYLQSQTAAPPMVVTNPDGTKTLYPAGAIPRGNSAPPTAPVGRLTPIPGGPTPGASGGFPLR